MQSVSKITQNLLKRKSNNCNIKKMKRKTLYLLLCIITMTANAQVTLKGVGHNNRYEDGDQMKSQYVGYNSTLQKPISIVDQSIYSMGWDSNFAL